MPVPHLHSEFRVAQAFLPVLVLILNSPRPFRITSPSLAPIRTVLAACLSACLSAAQRSAATVETRHKTMSHSRKTPASLPLASACTFPRRLLRVRLRRNAPSAKQHQSHAPSSRPQCSITSPSPL